MATHPLNPQFQTAQTYIGLGPRRTIAIAAHLEVRSVLCAAQRLIAFGLVDVLIGSYPRRTGIWPGKDVDVFAKLTNQSIDSITPEAAYQLFYGILLDAFRDRIEPQGRSIKVNYRSDRSPDQRFVVEAAKLLETAALPGPGDQFDFSVDVVPAVRFGDRWGIPNRDPATWTRQAASERWMCTDPERLTELTSERNAQLSIGGQGAYVPTVKMIRQIRREKLGDAKPGGLFMELLVYEGFLNGSISGDTWADLTASTLTYIANRLTTVTTTPLCDPALDQPYNPLPDPAATSHAATVFADLAAKATYALTADKCPAAASWRQILGSNTRANGPVFELPAGCTADGGVMPVFGSSGEDHLRGSNEARGFGDI